MWGFSFVYYSFTRKRSLHFLQMNCHHLYSSQTPNQLFAKNHQTHLIHFDDVWLCSLAIAPVFKLGWWSFTLCVIQLTDTECKLNPSSSSQPEIGYTLAIQDLYKDEIFHFIYYISSHAQRDRINTFYLVLVSIYHVGKCSWSWNKTLWCYIVPHTQFPLTLNIVLRK